MKRVKRISLGILASLGLVCSLAASAVTIDVQQGGTPIVTDLGLGTFVAGDDVKGAITADTIFNRDFHPNIPIEGTFNAWSFTLPAGSGQSVGNVLFDQPIEAVAWYLGDLNRAENVLSTGDIFTNGLELCYKGTSCEDAFFFSEDRLGYSLGTGKNVDQLLVLTATAVPLPAAAWLFLSGLVGVGVVARRKQATA